MTNTTWMPGRRSVVKGIGAALAANNAPIRFAIMATQVADHTD